MEIKAEQLKRIDKHVQDGSFKSVDAFVERAIELLLYAEDNKAMFRGAIRK